MPNQEIGLFQAKTHLSKLIDRVLAGESFYITKRGERVAHVEPVKKKKRRLKRGCAQHLNIVTSEDFDAPLEDFKDYMP